MPRTLMGRCRRLGHCGYINCICDVDPTDPRDMAQLKQEEAEMDGQPTTGPMVESTKPKAPHDLRALMPKTSTELRSFVIGCVAGIFIVIGSFVAVSEIAGLKWQPVSVSRR